jgi:DNA repair protein RadC
MSDTALADRFLRAGPDGMSDAELLGLWLDLSDQDAPLGLIRESGGLAGLMDAPAPRLEALGFDRAQIARLKAGRSLMERRWLMDLSGGEVLSSSAAVRRFLRSRLGGEVREKFGCLFLDSRHRLIVFETLFMGTVDRASVHPREILRRSLELNAAALILAHNHPSGVAEPSASDVVLTRDLTDLLGRVDVRVLDHLVISRASEVSFAERGLL